MNERFVIEVNETLATDERSQIEDQESEDLLEGLRLIELSEGENTTAKADELQNGTVGQMSQWESSNETSVDYEFQNSTVTDECHTFRECTAGCICTSMGKCVCLSKPSTTSEINKEQVRKTQYEAAFGHGRVRLLRPSQYNGKSHLRLAELQKLSRPTIFPGTSLTRAMKCHCKKHFSFLFKKYICICITGCPGSLFEYESTIFQTAPYGLLTFQSKMVTLIHLVLIIFIASSAFSAPTADQALFKKVTKNTEKVKKNQPKLADTYGETLSDESFEDIDPLMPRKRVPRRM
ncbi:unnamed protein product [Enterobius vermicularis]|uniref:EGF-like domain-containing protein n=1 Tax=Enterobius vermicularis TaxID=51028 RepID=A0A0N4VIF4_ENTVE|nr:unnamed protein product [Enterobius vermicularis]